MAEVCQNFAHNAWKKDLCTNCMKSIHEHEGVNFTETVMDKIETNNNSVIFNVRSMTTVYNSRNIENKVGDAKVTLRNSSYSEKEVVNASNINSQAVHGQSNVIQNRDSLNGLVSNAGNGNNVMIIQSGNSLNPSSTTKIIIGSSSCGNSNMTVIQSGNYSPNMIKCESDDVPELPDKNNKPVMSILKNNGPISYDKKKRKISIELEKIEVIGYGGESSGPPPEENQDPPDPEELPNTEEEKEIAKLTSNNTAWNCNKTNLLLDKRSKKIKIVDEKDNLNESSLENKRTSTHNSYNKSLVEQNKVVARHSPSKINNLYSTVPPRRKSPPPRVSVKPFFREMPMANTEQRLKINAVAPMRRKSDDLSTITGFTFSHISNCNSINRVTISSPPLKMKNCVNSSLSLEAKEQTDKTKIINDKIKMNANESVAESPNAPSIVDVELNSSISVDTGEVVNSKNNIVKLSPENSETSNLSYAVSPIVNVEPKSPSTCTFQATLAQNTPFRTFGKGDEIQPKISPPAPVSPPVTTGNGDLVPIIVNTLDRRKHNSRNSLINIVQTSESSKNGTLSQSTVPKEPSRTSVNKLHDAQLYDPVHNSKTITKEIKHPEIPVYAELSHDGSESYKSVDNQKDNSDRLSFGSKSDIDIQKVSSNPDPKNKDKRHAPAPPITSDSEVSSNPGEPKALTLPVSPSSVQSGSSEEMRGKSATFSGHSKKSIPTDKTPSGNDTISKKKGRFSLKRLLKFGSKDQENSERVSNLSNSPDDAPKFSFFSKSHKREDNSGLRKEDISPPILLEQCPVQERVAEWCARIPASTEIENNSKMKHPAPDPPDNQPIPSPTLLSEIVSFDGQQKLKKVKPLPPPRTKTLSESSLKSIEAKTPPITSKDNKPPSDKEKIVLRTSPKTFFTDYANLAITQPSEINFEGDIRSSITPKKPDRGTTNTSEDEEVEILKRKAPPPPVRTDKVQSCKESSNIFQYSPDKIGNVLASGTSTRPASFPSTASKSVPGAQHVTCIRISDVPSQEESPKKENNLPAKVNQFYSKYKVIELPQPEMSRTSHKTKAPPIPEKQSTAISKVIELSTPTEINKKPKPPQKEVNQYKVFNVTYQKSENSPDSDINTKLVKQIISTDSPENVQSENTNSLKLGEAKLQFISLSPSDNIVERELLDPSAQIMITTVQTANQNIQDIRVIEKSYDKSLSNDKDIKEHKIKRSVKMFSRNNEVSLDKVSKLNEGVENVVDSLTQATLRVVAINKPDNDELVLFDEKCSSSSIKNTILDESKTKLNKDTSGKTISQNIPSKINISSQKLTHSNVETTSKEKHLTQMETETERIARRQQIPDTLELKPPLKSNIPDSQLSAIPCKEEFSKIIITFNNSDCADSKLEANEQSGSMTVKEIKEFKEDEKISQKFSNTTMQKNIAKETKFVIAPSQDTQQEFCNSESNFIQTELIQSATVSIQSKLDHSTNSNQNDLNQLETKLLSNCKSKQSKLRPDSHIILPKHDAVSVIESLGDKSELKTAFSKETPTLNSESQSNIRESLSGHYTTCLTNESIKSSQEELLTKNETDVPKTSINELPKIILTTKEASSYKSIEMSHLKMKDLNAKVTVSSLQKMFEPSCARKITPSHPIDLAETSSKSDSLPVVVVELNPPKPESLYKTNVSALQKMFETNQFKRESLNSSKSVEEIHDKIALSTKPSVNKITSSIEMLSSTHTYNLNNNQISQPNPAKQQKLIENVPSKTIVLSEPIVTVRSYSDAFGHANVKAQSLPPATPAQMHVHDKVEIKMHDGEDKHESSHVDVLESTPNANLFGPIAFSTLTKSFDSINYKKPCFASLKDSTPALSSPSLPSKAIETYTFKVPDEITKPLELSADHSISSTMHRRKSGSFEELTNRRPPRPLLKRSRESFRLVFNKSLEENYSSITNANLESLAQMMDHLAKDFTGESVFRINDKLKWSDFVLVSTNPQIATSYGVFYEAKWKYDELQLYTLMVSQGRGLIGARPQYLHSLRSIAQFNDQIPAALLSTQSSDAATSSTLRPATIEVLTHCSLQSLQSFVQHNAKVRQNKLVSYEREVCFLLLQVVSGLKFLQAQGVEELTNTLDHFILIKNDNETFNRFVILNAEVFNMPSNDKPPSSKVPRLSLCHCVLKLMKLFVDGEETTSNFALTNKSQFSVKLSHVAAILKLEKADSLTWAMSAFEYLIWGPAKAPWSDAAESDNLEQVAQMWLDLERARVVNSILRHSISGEVELGDIEEYQIPFLVRSTPQKLLDVHHIISEKAV